MTWLHERTPTDRKKKTSGETWQCRQIMDCLNLIADTIKFKNPSPFTGHKIPGNFRYINFNPPCEPLFPVKFALVAK